MKTLLLLTVVATLAACGPFQIEQYEEIGPNETAFVLPLEGASNAGQARFDSAAFLESKKVAAKRITIPTRRKDTGRTAGDFEWIPTVKIVRVNRAPITREWTDAKTSDDSNHSDDSIHVESKESIGFHVGASITAHVEEEAAATFLYHYGGKTLGDVVDTNVRSFVQMSLMQRFGGAMLADCMDSKGRFFSETLALAQAEFKTRGVTVDFFGMQGGLSFDNDKVQETIDRRFVAENEANIAVNQTAAQIERNKQKVAEAEGEAAMKIAQVRGEAERIRQMADADAYTVLQKAKAEAEGNRLRAQALEGDGGARLVSLAQVERWTGGVPQFLFGGTTSPSFLMSLPQVEKSK